VVQAEKAAVHERHLAALRERVDAQNESAERLAALQADIRAHPRRDCATHPRRDSRHASAPGLAPRTRAGTRATHPRRCTAGRA
jgi:cystathionine beta-lyase/cystathionine gamma-synthase